MTTISEMLARNSNVINEALALFSTLDDITGKYVWKKLTTDGEFVTYVVADDANAYPDGEVEEGYLYEIYQAPSLQELTADATATPDKVISGYTAYANGEKIEGTAIAGDGTWVEKTTATSTGKVIYSAHDNPNAIYGGGYLPKTQDSGSTIYYHACCCFYNKTLVHMTGTTTGNSGNAMPYVNTASVTISGNKITIPSFAYSSDPSFTVNLSICHV